LGGSFNEGLVLLTSYETYSPAREGDTSGLRKQVYKGDWQSKNVIEWA